MAKINYRCNTQTPQAIRTYMRSVIDFLESSGVVESVDVGVLELLEDALTTRWQCMRQIKKDGLTVLDRYKCRKAHPLLATKEKAHSAVMTALRELGLTVRSRKDLPDLQEATKEQSPVEEFFSKVLEEGK